MPVTINASPTNGLVQTADGSGVIKLQSNGVTTNALAWGSYVYVASGSVPTLGSAYNISSITRNSAGNYTFAFTNAMPNVNYAVVVTTNSGSTFNSSIGNVTSKATNNMGVQVGYVSSTAGPMTNFDYALDFAIFGT